MSDINPSNTDLDQLEAEIEHSLQQPPAFDDPLEDLYTEAQLAHGQKTRRHKKEADPSIREALAATTKRMQDLYTLPENWERTRGIALVDKGTMTLVGNFSEYVHKSIQHTRKLLREYHPISIDATEIVEGYLGDQTEQRLKAATSWTERHHVQVHVIFPDWSVGSPNVDLDVHLYLGAINRVDLEADTQFASESGNTIFMLPKGTNIWPHMGEDCRKALRKEIGK